MSDFSVDDEVIKNKGKYDFHSTVQAVFQNRDGDTRLVCESIDMDGLLHIFSPEQMELLKRKCRFVVAGDPLMRCTQWAAPNGQMCYSHGPQMMVFDI